MNNDIISPPFRQSLFWDTDLKNIDTKKNARYIIERILKFGSLADYSWLKITYSPDEIREVIMRDRSELDKRSLNFWRSLYNIE